MKPPSECQVNSRGQILVPRKMDDKILPPSLVAIFQTVAAIETCVKKPLEGCSKMEGVDYILSTQTKSLKDQLTAKTRLLVVGSDRGSVTEELSQLVARARELNPNVRVVVYSAFEMPELNPADTIIKGTELAAERFVMEVAHAIDVAKK